MKENYFRCLKMLLKHEDGFVNHPNDSGGMKSLGVTKTTLEEYWGREVTELEMRSLTPDEVAPLYKAKYWDAIRGDDLASGLDWACFDWCVNSGSRRPAQALQRIVSAKPDGKIGTKTLQAIAKSDPLLIVEKLHDSRQNLYESLRTFPTFGKGWTRRNKETMEQAISMTAV